MSLTIEKMNEDFGARVYGVDLSEPLDDPKVREIRDLWAQYQLLVFPGQKMDEESHMRFAEYFGEPAELLDAYEGKRQRLSEDKPDYFLYITTEPMAGHRMSPKADGEQEFHMDNTYFQKPTRISFLYGLTIPSAGGGTRFSSAIRAYSSLPEDVQERIKGLSAVHADFGEKFVHPMVVRHPETGRNILFACRIAKEVVGVDKEEGQRLLQTTWDSLEEPNHVITYNWTPGDFVMWDNWSLVHARADFDPKETRVLRRLTIKGDQPEAAFPAAVSQ